MGNCKISQAISRGGLTGFARLKRESGFFFNVVTSHESRGLAQLREQMPYISALLVGAFARSLK
jgi:predicted chitinase